MMMDNQEYFNNHEDNSLSPKKRKFYGNNNEDIFSDIFSTEEMVMNPFEKAETTNFNYLFDDVIMQGESDPVFSMNPQQSPTIVKKENMENVNNNNNIINKHKPMINNNNKNYQQVVSNMPPKNFPVKENTVNRNNIFQSTYTLDISPKTRVSNNPKDISVTVSIKIPFQNVKDIKNFPDKILLWSANRKLTEKVMAISEDGVNEVQVDTSTCFVVLIHFDLRDKDDVFISNCNEHLAKEKQGCQFSNYPGPCLFRHVGSLSSSTKLIQLENSSVNALFLTRTFPNLKIDKKGHFCKSSKYKLYLNSHILFPVSLQYLGLSCTQKLATNVNYSKQIVTDCYWVEKLINVCHSAQLRFSSQRVFAIAINSPQLSEELSKIISSFQHVTDVDVRYVNPFISSNFVVHLLSSLYEKSTHLKLITVYGSIEQWKKDPNYWNLIEKLNERFWDLKIQFFSSGLIQTREN
eukprot:TRINITY_DN1225_c0_g1_i1.p1 TRINITY_DN1225_c0_g1~~TRINITY_DN1225_c0_g1_i1.p1  ORF type:complete len:464 (+),score=150.91 TRINITY_DN1225_c0_g1_i1:112-1503(+)